MYPEATGHKHRVFQEREKAMTAPATRNGSYGGPIVVSEDNNQSRGLGHDNGQRIPVYSVILPVFYAQGWASSIPGAYNFILLYTMATRAGWDSYRVESVDYIDDPSNIPDFPKSRVRLKEELRRAIAAYLQVNIQHVRKFNGGIMWFEEANGG